MHVGMNRGPGGRGRPRPRVPHARGDEPDFQHQLSSRLVSSPCTWG